MNKITELFITTAYAQAIGTADKRNKWEISDFEFLNLFKPKTDSSASTAFNSLLASIIGIALTLAAIVAFFYLLWAGFQYITAGGDATKATGARTAIVNALIGIIVILIAYVVLAYVGTSIVPTTTK